MGGVGGFSLAESGSLGAGAALSAGGAVGLGALGAVGGAAVGGVEAGFYLNNNTPVGSRIGEWNKRLGTVKMMEWAGDDPKKQAIAAIPEVLGTVDATVLGLGQGGYDMVSEAQQKLGGFAGELGEKFGRKLSHL